MTDQSQANAVTGNDAQFKNLIEGLKASSRRERQNSATAIAQLSKDNIQLAAPYHEELVDALNRPEAQTRWECLDILTALVNVESRLCDKAVPGAEAALFDETSGPLRLSAMRFLCKLGSTTPSRSQKVWPLIDEGIQCYHGDYEFSDMLAAVTDFSAGKLAPEVKEQLGERMAFDAKNGRGQLKKRASIILENTQPKK